MHVISCIHLPVSDKMQCGFYTRVPGSDSRAPVPTSVTESRRRRQPGTHLYRGIVVLEHVLAP